MISSPVGKTDLTRSFCNPNSLKPVSLPLYPPSQGLEMKGMVKNVFAMAIKRITNYLKVETSNATFVPMST